ncbi:MAG: M20/M25/M40 family metallo-hydrolase [Candidatus Melainabacteria bacterium]|nr:M20/M25/M40 family metallo-hydrolase [Candidatus Melainabacteria bacterium]
MPNTLTPAQTERLLEAFLTMVRIDSPSGHEAAMHRHLHNYFASFAAQGVRCQADAVGNLIVDVPAHQCTHSQVLVISGHMDVVPPCIGVQPLVETVDGVQWVRSDNTTVLGADDKAALAAIVEVVGDLLQAEAPRPALRLIFTVHEEDGMDGAKAVATEHLDAAFSIIFDHTGPPGTIVTRAPSYIHYEITCAGKSTHAGIAPEQGVNAIVFAARVISQLPTGRIDSQTTANVALVRGGKATNIVPDEVRVEGELRGHDPIRLEELMESMRQTLTEVSLDMPGSDYTFHHQELFPAYAMDPNHPGVQRVVDAVRAVGYKPQLITTNGGSDNNIFIDRGLPGVVLSAGYVDPHALTERIQVTELAAVAVILRAIIGEFCRAPISPLETALC